MQDPGSSLYVESFVAPGNPWAARECLMAVGRIVERLAVPENVENVYAIAASKGGTAVVERLGFTKLRDASLRRDGHTLYCGTLPDLCRNISDFARREDRKQLLAMFGRSDDLSTL